MEIAAAAVASVCALLAICAAGLIYRRSTPARLLFVCQEAQERAAKAEGDVARLRQQVEDLKGSWHTTQENLEKYLDSIDSRARRLSATRSQEERQAKAQQQGDGATDVESLLAALRADQGI